MDGLRIFRSHGYTATPVIDFYGHYLGSITEGDFLYYIADHPHFLEEDLKTVEISDLIRKEFMPPVSFNVSMSELFQRSLEQNYVPVVDDRNIFIGIVTRKSIISYLMKEVSLVQPTFANEAEARSLFHPVFTLR